MIFVYAYAGGPEARLVKSNDILLFHAMIKNQEAMLYDCVVISAFLCKICLAYLSYMSD